MTMATMLYAGAGIAVVVAIVALLMRRVRLKTRVVASAAALITGLALVIVAQTDARPGGPRGKLVTPAARLATLDNSLRAIEDGLRNSPRDRWDPDYVVNQLGRDPQLLFAWVRENTNWIPYRGTLRGPAGVLMDRQGNSLDRALLLATLLEKAGHPVRLARGELSREQALDLLPGLVSRQALPPVTEPGTDAPQEEAKFETVAARYQLDGNSIERTLEVQEQGVTKLLTELNARVADQTARLLKGLQRPDAAHEWDSRFASATAALRDHWWVQWADGSRNLDLLAPDSATGGATLTTANSLFTVTDLPADLHHELVVRVVSEQWSRGKLEESRILEHAMRPAKLLGQPVVLQVWPSSWPRELHPDPNSKFGLRGAALEQHQWTAMLAVGDDVAAQGIIAPASDARAPASGNPFGGIGGAIAAQPPPAQPAGQRTREITATWIEYEIRAPGEPSRTIRRAIFDLFGPAARANSATSSLVMDERKRLTRSLALMIRTEILPVSTRLAPEFVMHLMSRGLVENRGVLRSLVGNLASLDSIEPATLLAKAKPTVSPLYSLALARLDWSRHQNRQYVDRIGVLTRHRHPGLAGDALTIRSAVEIVAKDLGVSLAEPDAFTVRHAQGVLDTNAEALWWVGEGLNNTGEAYKLSRDWVTLTPSDAGKLDELPLPPDARARIRQDLATGFAVIAPKIPVPAGPDHFVGWWRIDPATGATVGVAGNGWGQCGTEYGLHLRTFAAFARGFMFEYALCQGIMQAMNDFRYVGAELQARGIWFWWVGPIQSADPEDVFWQSNKGCLIGAMMAGFVSTLPFLISRYNAAWGEWSLPKPGLLEQAMRNQRGGARIPPSITEGMPRTGGEAPPVEGLPTPPEPSAASQPSPPQAPRRGARYNARPADPGRAPPGRGPFQGNPENRRWLRENWDPDPVKSQPAARAMGSPTIYDNADRAAIQRYTQARSQGLPDVAARQQSYEEWWQSVQSQRRSRGILQIPGLAEPGGGAWPEWVPEPPSPPGSSPPPGSPPPGSPPPGTPPPGSQSGSTAPMQGAAPGSSETAVGVSGLATTFNPVSPKP